MYWTYHRNLKILCHLKSYRKYENVIVCFPFAVVYFLVQKTFTIKEDSLGLVKGHYVCPEQTHAFNNSD